MIPAEDQSVRAHKIIWITWENQRRNRELSQALDIKLFELDQIGKIKNPLKKYLVGVTKTLRILLKERPNIVFCQNPSLVLALLLIILRQLSTIKVCVDAHNAGLFPKEGQSALLGYVANLVQKNADLTMVTNEALKKHVEMNGGRAFVLPDRIPDVAAESSRKLKGKTNILFICSFADDEPFEAAFDACRKIDPNICVYVTGNYKKKNFNPSRISTNIQLTGFLPEIEYREMLNSVDATMILTLRENCLVCGAYESVAANKPMVLSDTEALRRYFSRGAVYVDNSVNGIAEGINGLSKELPRLRLDLAELEQTLSRDWDTIRHAFLSRIEAMV
jgi:glycosyltransferase involved in cell wall biosynthesis